MRFSLAFLLLALLAAFPSAAAATWPGKAGRIVYHALDDDDEGVRDGIYSIGPGGHGNRRVVRHVDEGVASSRDGSRIAFIRNGALWQARSDGSRVRRVVRPKRGSASDPAWSPSGRRLVFTVAGRQIWVVRRDGKKLRKLGPGRAATWSSRNQIAYATKHSDVATMRPGGRGRHIWVPQGSPVVVLELDFSPDGRRLVYKQSTRQLTKDTIRTVNLRTGKRTRFRDFTRRVTTLDVIWAPGGHRLAFVHRPQSNGATQLRTIRPNGKGLKKVFDFPSGLTPFAFAWQTR